MAFSYLFRRAFTCLRSLFWMFTRFFLGHWLTPKSKHVEGSYIRSVLMTYAISRSVRETSVAMRYFEMLLSESSLLSILLEEPSYFSSVDLD